MESNQPFGNEKPSKQIHSVDNRVIIGVVLIVAGLFLVMRNTGIFPDFIDDVIFSWQMLLIVIGLLITLSSQGSRSGGIIIMAVGAFFLVPRIFDNLFDVHMFWPMIFIVIGLVFIFSKRRGWNSVSTTPRVGDDFIDLIHIFSGGERQIVSDNFKGGKVTAIFGGSEIDLTQAKMAPGAWELELTCIFGGTTIIVPDDWNVKIEVTPVLGGFGDSRKLHPGRTIDMSRQLIIRGAIVFGGGELKSY